MSFSLDITKFVIKAKGKGDLVVRRIAFEAFSRVILKTPVDTGRARANWIVGIGEIPKGTVPAGASPFSGSMSKISTFKLGQVIYLANSLPYIGVLEYGGYPNPAKTGTKTVNGFSRQAPQGMVGVTMAEMDQIYTKALASMQ